MSNPKPMFTSPTMPDTTLQRVQPIVSRIYGRLHEQRSQELAVRLAERIDAWEPRDPEDTREDMVREMCWSWFSGGSTAAIVARDIEGALNDSPRSG